MLKDADLSVRLSLAALSCEEEEYLALVLEAANLESRALDFDVDARVYNDPSYLSQAEELRGQSRAILDGLPVKKASIDAQRQILGVVLAQ